MRFRADKSRQRQAQVSIIPTTKRFLGILTARGDAMKTSRRLRLSGMILASAIGAFVASAGAQTRPMPPDPYDPNTMNQPAPQQAAPMNNGYGASSSNQGPPDYPAAEINQLPAAKARETVARAVYDRARTALYNTVDNIYEDFH